MEEVGDTIILLLNTGAMNPIDNLSIQYRGYYPRDNQFDILKYTVSSMAAVDRWSLALFYITLMEPYQHRWDELLDHIHKEFAGICPVEVYGWRNEYQSQWKETFKRVEKEDDPYIWFSCNHDQIFTDYDLTALESALTDLTADPESRKSVYFSYFPEIYRKFKKLYPNDFTILPCGNIAARGHWMESTQIVSKELLYSWLVEPDYGNAHMPRTDWKEIAETAPYRLYIPSRELCKHYDGVGYVLDPTKVPPLSIPPGFFENKIKIDYAFPETVRDNSVSVNPLRPYKTVTPDGVDYRCTMEDLPMFWNGKIEDVVLNPHRDDSQLLQSRNTAMVDYLTAESIHPNVPNDMPSAGWIQRSLR